MMKLILRNINTVGALKEALAKLPADASLTPFGDSNALLVYDRENKTAYIDSAEFFDEEFDFDVDEKRDAAEITIVVKDGMVQNVFSKDGDIQVEILDLDSDSDDTSEEEERVRELEESDEYTDII